QYSAVSGEDFKAVEDTLRKIHSQTKAVVGMKVLAEGHLKNKVKKAVEYVRDLEFVDSFIIGMLNKEEIKENCRIIKYQ
ncbi:MAG: hypothetical protein L0922_07500, partial [Candidatus Mariimomonas ferrooxydans]